MPLPLSVGGPRLSVGGPSLTSSAPGSYLHVVVLLPQDVVVQKLVDGNDLPPWRKEKAGGPVGQGAGNAVQGWGDSSPGHGRQALGQ